MKQLGHLITQNNRILEVLLPLTLVLMLTGCEAGSGDRVERFADAAPDSGVNIAVPGYETLSFKAESELQTVNLKNPAENACTFVMTLTLDEDGETIWKGEALQPGEAYTRITLTRALSTGEYGATLHYDCFSLQDNTPLNGAEIQLTIEVR